MEGSSASSSRCTVAYVGGTASVSCVDSTSSEYQVILLQINDPYNLTVVNVTSGEKQTVPVVPSGKYCIMELPMGYNESEVKYSREFTAEENDLDATPSYTVDVIGIASKSTVSIVSIVSMYYNLLLPKLFNSSHKVWASPPRASPDGYS